MLSIIISLTSVFPLNIRTHLGQTEPAFNIEYITEADAVRGIRSLRPSQAKYVIGMNTVMLKELSESLRKLSGTIK